MPFAAGDTFLYPIGNGCNEHLWIIATNPDGDGFVAIVSFTSLRGNKDQTVVLLAKEHQFVKWDTCVHYGLAEIKHVDAIAAAIVCGEAIPKDPVTPELLSLIVDGFMASEFTRPRICSYVKEQKRLAREQASGRSS